MESEQHHYELRSKSRSRSHTPMVSSHPLTESETTDHHYDLRNKSRERSHTPGEAKSSGSRLTASSSSKMHEKNMETIEENKEGSMTESLTDNQSTKSESSTIITKKAERRSERQRAKKQIYANGQNETKGGTSNQKSGRKRKSITPHRIFTSDYSSEEGEREDPPSRSGSAYEIYKQAGEWWNVFPKTDYTYSQASQCRYEIAPGILAMPNMSRRSLHSDDSDNNTIYQVSHSSQKAMESGFSDVTDIIDLKETSSRIRSSQDNFHNVLRTSTSDSTEKSAIHKKTHIEQYTTHREIIYSESENSPSFRQRYFPWSNNQRSIKSHKYSTSQFDSDTELEESFASIKSYENWKIVQWLTYFMSFVIAWIRKTIGFFKFGADRRRRYNDTQVYRSYNESRWSTLWKSLGHYSHKIYFFFVRILVFDAWLLSQFTGIRKWLQEKGSKILWITLLPLFLLIGCWCIAQCLSLLPAIKIASEAVTKKLSFNAYNTRNDKLKLSSNDDLIGRIEMLENEQAYQMDKITDVKNKLDNNELNNIIYSELKIIKHEFERLRELYSELKTCCNTNIERITNQDIEKHVEKILFNYLPPGISKVDLAKISQKLFSSYTKEDQAMSNNDVRNVNVHISDEDVRKIVKEVLRIYDADKTGQVDYALESAGGQIISTRCTQKYDIKSRAFSLFGFTLFYESNNPRIVIQGKAVQPGVCWAFQDFPGYLLIQLRSSIYVTGFTLEHVPKLILPNENMSSAPKKFDVWGLTNENDLEPVLFGDYEFIYSDDSLQYFSVQNTKINRPYEYIELRIHSNHGQLEYTCLYRFRVHGRPA